VSLIDYHVHTIFSEDGRSSPEECLAAAVARGLGGVILTEHLEFIPSPDDLEPAYIPGRVLAAAAYVQTGTALRAAWRDRLSVGLGVELGLEPHNLTACGPYLRESGLHLHLDYVLGSLHSILGTLVQLSEYTDPLGPRAAAKLYFERLRAGIRRAVELRACDAIGHLDLVKRSPTFGGFRLADHRADVEDILRIIIAAGVGLEVNTSGWRQPPGEPYPGLETLKLYRKLGGEIVTIGSDSHSSQTVGMGAERALQLIRAAGFTHVTLFSSRKPRFVKV
jgi:histidinol-phosphatase (PHP family)